MNWLVIAGMMLVTWVPRFVPLAFSRDLPLPRWIRRWLSLFPYAALGALIGAVAFIKYWEGTSWDA